MDLKNNSNVNYCKKCKGNLCDKCKNIHNDKHPKHKQISAKVNHLDSPEEEINELPEFKCLVCSKNLSDKIDEPIANCNKCNGNLCEDCSRSHNSEFPRHRLEYKLNIPNKNQEQSIQI